MTKIKEWLVSFICENIVVGGHCGLCGKWVPNVLVPRYWQWTVCLEHCDESFKEDQQRIRANMATAKAACLSRPPTKERNT